MVKEPPAEGHFSSKTNHQIPHFDKAAANANPPKNIFSNIRKSKSRQNILCDLRLGLE